MSSDIAARVLLLVYGTLKRGFPNHGQMSAVAGESARFVCAAKTVAEHPLVVSRDYQIPFLLDLRDDSAAQRVLGEVYEVDRAALAHLDRFEGAPDWYVRREVEVELAPGGEVTTFAYFLREPSPAQLALPRVCEYTMEHVEGYVPREQRR